MDLDSMGRKARQAFELISRRDGAARQQAVLAIAAHLEAGFPEALAANRKDVALAKEAGLTPALIDRLTLDEKRLKGIVSDLRHLAELPDPIGEVYDERTLPNGMRLWRQRVPLGVLGVIYESRPNVTVDVAGLAVKTGNTALLRGGKETLHSNRALIVIIPRGGNSLHQFCRQHATIPVITGGIGVCHLYVDTDADLERALPLIHNAKTQRPSVCNALDTLLVHESIAPAFLPRVIEYLGRDGVTFRAEPQAAGLLDDPRVLPASPEDFDTEWLSLVLGLKVVPDLEAAIQHIRQHSTHHSDGILTGNSEHAGRFIHEVDSAAVYVNASTRFTDGAQFGLGAEVAVSTQRLHARGPMGLPELTTYKWVGIGDYTVRK
jgi:glutamate-5-semialdehyde dehydrogenase